MTIDLRLGMHAGRIPVVRKRGSGPSADALRREAELLAAAAGDGVVEVVTLDDVEDDDGQPAVDLVLRLVPGGALRPAAVGGVGELAAVGAGLARAVAGLHGRGVAHRRIEPDHILISGRSGWSVTLCGLGSATSDPTEAELTADGGAVRSLLRSLAADVVAPPEQHRWEEALEDSRPLGDLAAVLAGLGPPPAEPPLPGRTGGARAAGRVRSGLAGASRSGLTAASRSGRRRPSRPVLVGAAVLVVVVGTVAALMLGGGGGEAPGRADGRVAEVATAPSARDEAADPEAASAASTGPAASTGAVEATAPPPVEPTVRFDAGPVCPDVAHPAVDLDDDGCPEPVTVAAGRISVGGVDFALGDDDDLTLVGDWECDGRLLPGLVTVPEGWVYLFDRWPDDQPTEATAVDALGPVTAAEVVSQRCPALEVVTADGSVTTVTLGRSA